MRGKLRVPSGRSPVSFATLVARLGLPPAEVERLRKEGTLAVALVDRLVFPEQPRYTAEQLGEMTGMGDDVARWSRTFGLPDPIPGETVFTDADVELFQFVHDLLGLQISGEHRVLAVNRIIGGSMARLAAATVDGLTDRSVDMERDGDQATADFANKTAQLMGEALPIVMQYAWLKHLRVALRRRISLASASGANTEMAVGFADLVGFTTLVQRISEDQLASMLNSFEATVVDVVSAYGGRVVKHIGDEAMFAFDEPEAAVEVGLRLAEIHHFDETLPELRVGIGYGPVLSREGDLFGPMVNKASRIVPLCLPGTVLVAEELADAVGDTERVVLVPLGIPRHLKGIGPEDLWVARWPDQERADQQDARTADQGVRTGS